MGNGGGMQGIGVGMRGMRVGMLGIWVAIREMLKMGWDCGEFG